MKCSICQKEIEPLVKDGKVVWDQGNDAWPVNDGRCCGDCDMNVVVPARIQMMKNRREI